MACPDQFSMVNGRVLSSVVLMWAIPKDRLSRPSDVVIVATEATAAAAATIPVPPRTVS
ncbi:unannotated protein [freshwater metagenome]|uniref:Unannotated protein n=1 Tax=freshwater metagenome TaxID=449393 RepID=A0A6J7ASH0_9ZZZZ